VFDAWKIFDIIEFPADKAVIPANFLNIAVEPAVTSLKPYKVQFPNPR
jgi:hypothetical protein